jgi:diguanylate cyclase (GGDEF)-like protein
MAMKIIRPSLKLRIISVILILILFSEALVSITSLYTVENNLKKFVGDHEYALLSSAAFSIEQELDARRRLLQTVAEHLKAQAPSTYDEVFSILATHAALREVFFNVVVFDSAGELISNLSNPSEILIINAAKRKYFTDTIATRSNVISKAFISPLSGRPIVLITQPVFDLKGRIHYVLAGGIDLQSHQVFGQLKTLKAANAGYFFVTEADGTIIQHADRSRILANVNKEVGGVTPTTAAALRGFEGWSEGIAKDGRSAIISYKRLNRGSWIIGTVLPTGDAFQAIINARKNAWGFSALVALLAAAVALLAIIGILRPLDVLRHKIDNISQGDSDISTLQSATTDEVGELSRAFFTLARQRKTVEEKLALLVRTDTLTGINNRRMFVEAVPLVIARAARAKSAIAIAYLDIDDFKHINDTYGHAAGDQVLIEFARRLASAIRGTDILARLSGDEFVILFEPLASNDDLSGIGDKILSEVRKPFICGGVSISVTTSIGMAFCELSHVHEADLLRCADEALYSAKKSGRDQYFVSSFTADKCEQ